MSHQSKDAKTLKLEQAGRRNGDLLGRVARLHALTVQENRVLTRANDALHDRMTGIMGDTTPGAKAGDSEHERAYLLAAETRRQAARTAGTLRELKRTIRPLE